MRNVENNGTRTPGGITGKGFLPGRSGNPGGRPNMARLTEAVRKYLDEKTGGKTRLRQVLESLQKNDPKILLQYAYGKATESVEMKVEKTTVAGLPEEYLAVLREHAQRL